MVLPLEPSDVPGVYRRGSKFVVVHRVDGRQRKQLADAITMAGARAIKLRRDACAAALRCTGSACRGQCRHSRDGLLEANPRSHGAFEIGARVVSCYEVAVGYRRLRTGGIDEDTWRFSGTTS